MKNISLKIKFSIMFIIAYLFASLGCGDQPLFDELATNRVKVIIKGTYESNGPAPWYTGTFDSDDSIYVNTAPTPAEVNPSVFMLDIAGIKVASGGQSQYFANYRKTYSAAINDTDPFFNGEGVFYKNNDMRPNFTWPTVQVYIRKMLFNNAKQYYPSTTIFGEWTYEKDVEDMFNENTVNAFNFNLAQVLSYYDSLKSNYADINRIFPLTITVEDGFVFDKNDPETVLEIRLVVKNFLKKYEYEYIDSLDSSRKLRHFYALSDWLRNIFRDEAAPTTDTLGKMGGNVLAVARSYVPGKVATIEDAAGCTDCYIAAVKTNTNYSITIPERPSNSTFPIYDAPKTPRLPLNPSGTFSDAYMQALLDYYLQYEVYKQYYDNFIANVNSGQYETEWNSYESTLNAYKIPQLVTWVDASGVFTITNVPIGPTYKILRANGVGVGQLPSTYSQIGTATVVNDNGGIPIPMD